MKRYNEVEMTIAWVINKVILISLFVIPVYLSYLAFGYYSQLHTFLIYLCIFVNLVIFSLMILSPWIWLQKGFKESRIEFLNLLAYEEMSLEKRMEYSDELKHR